MFYGQQCALHVASGMFFPKKKEIFLPLKTRMMSESEIKTHESICKTSKLSNQLFFPVKRITFLEIKAEEKGSLVHLFC